MTGNAQRTAGALLIASLLSIAYADFHSYVLTFYANPDAWGPLLRGTASAPEQYRVGIVRLAALLCRHVPLRMDHAFTLLDLSALLLSGLILFRQLVGAEAFRRASPAQRWFALIGLLFLLQFYLFWLLSPQRPETLPATLFVVLSAALLASPGEIASRPARSPLGYAARMLALLLLAAAGATFRADVVLAFGAGLALAGLFRRSQDATLPRGLTIATGVATAAIAVAAQLYLARMVYPDASYGRVKLWQLRPNLIHPDRWLPFALFMLPLLWTARQAARAWARAPSRLSGAQRTLLFSAAVYLLLWIAVGKLDEVRIMLPFALALAPLTMESAMEELVDPTNGPSGLRTGTEPGAVPLAAGAESRILGSRTGPDSCSELNRRCGVDCRTGLGPLRA